MVFTLKHVLSEIKDHCKLAFLNGGLCLSRIRLIYGYFRVCRYRAAFLKNGQSLCIGKHVLPIVFFDCDFHI